MSADRDGACPRCDLEYGHDEPCNRPVGEVPPRFASGGYITGGVIAKDGGPDYIVPLPDPYQALLTQLHEARADRQQTAEENRDLLAENLRLRSGDGCPECHAPSWRELHEVKTREAALRAGIDGLVPCADLLLAAEASWGGWAHKYVKLGRSLRALLDGEVRP